MADRKKKRGKGSKVVKPVETFPFKMEITDIRGKKWYFGKEIGSGGCGVVYDGTDGTPGFNYVIKVEYHENGSLFSEKTVYSKIAKPEDINSHMKKTGLSFLGLCAYHGFGSFLYRDTKYRFIVCDKLGKDLQTILKENDNLLHPKTVFTVGVILVNVLNYIHSCKYVHQDIKAANLLLGPTKSAINDVCLIDLGLATRYESQGGIHKSSRPDPSKANNGTPEFLSRDGHIGVFCRRSDFEILAYNMLLWLSGTLPWLNVIQDLVKLKAEKEKYMNNVPELMKKLFPGSRNIYPEMQEFVLSVSNLKFEDAPKYDEYIKLFKKALKRLHLKDDGILILTKPSQNVDQIASKDAESSQKENNRKKGGPKKRSAKSVQDESSSSSLPSGEILTPAMLDVLNRKHEKAAEKASKKSKKI